MLSAYTLDAIPDTPDVEQLKSTSRTFYHIGFNVRNAPFSNTHFRRAVSQLIDKEAIVEDVFYGHATPVATPVTDEWIPESLEWNGEDPVLRFLGSDGELNVEAAKATFESAGFRYDDNGRLLEATLGAMLAEVLTQVAVVIAILVPVSIIVFIGRERLARTRSEWRTRLKTTAPMIAVLIVVLLINRVARQVAPKLSRQIGIRLTSAFYNIEGSLSWSFRRFRPRRRRRTSHRSTSTATRSC